MEDINVRVNFFGAFRQYGETCELKLPKGSRIKVVKEKLLEQVQNLDPKLVQASVLATDQTLLTGDDDLNNNCDLSILPPVCGG